MMRKRITLLFTYILTLLFVVQPVFAGTSDKLCGLEEPNPADFASEFFGCGISLVGGVALLFIIYGGFILLTSTGDPGRVRMGKEYIQYAVVGLVLAIFTVIIFEVIGADLLKIPGLNR